MISQSSPPSVSPDPADTQLWSSVKQFEKPCRSRAVWQLVNTLGSFLALWVAIYFALQISFWLAVPIALVSAGLLVRIFIIFHDCTHGSFFRSSKANIFWGTICGVFTFTSFRHWKWEHSVHHATSGNLDRRGCGDIWTMTVEEYRESSRLTKFFYRLARNPFMLFVIGPLFLFLIRERFPNAEAKKRARRSVYLTNLALLAMAVTGTLIFGFWNYFLLQVMIMGVAGSAGVWLFYVQHQFEDAYWEKREDWCFKNAALEGSSFYKLPKVLQWFSGNIGYHHIHHLSPRIPNYNLERCHHSNETFRQTPPLTIRKSLRSLGFRLWDEAARKMVGYAGLRSS